MEGQFNGLGMGLGNLSRISKAKTRSISPENLHGEKGRGAMATEGIGSVPARDLGVGWKISESIPVKPGDTFTFAEIAGPGAIQSLWIAGLASEEKGFQRLLILRIYWDNQETPSIETPLGDFFASGWHNYAHVNSFPVSVNPNRGFNCYWEMPFRNHCRMTLQNLSSDTYSFYYQVNYTLTDVPDDAAYFHAQFRRVNPIPYKSIYTILDGVKGTGQFVGTYLAVGVTNNGWWGEGEIKFYLDGDKEYPTICGTGTEDYFGGSYGWVVNNQYVPYSTPFLGVHQIIKPDGLFQSQQRFGMYRWHIMDPIRFEQDIRVTIHALGWAQRGFLPLQCDMASVAFWYQTLPTTPFPTLPERDYLEII
jgi:hypothetical protein